MRIIGILVLLMLIALPSAAQFRTSLPYTLLTRTHGSVEFGWYASSDVYKYIADLNTVFTFGSWGDAKFSFRGGILTLIKSTDEDSFQPDRYRGTLEPGIYWETDKNIWAFSIRHQSFHTIDRAPPFDESYELYNISYQRLGSPNILLSVGKYLNTNDVDYEWDYFAQIDTGCIGVCRYGDIYFSALGHYVDEGTELSTRSSFFDYNLEVGIQTKNNVRYFTAYRLIHDVDQFDGVTDNQWLIGVKYIW
ncbi:MAG TPA: hypothetical protein PLZ21_08655 [Armatimonadota bacterium]|jgi:hypothetical protein|nr:hypothetical protein [Armatimonadota bacterium]